MRTPRLDGPEGSAWASGVARRPLEDRERPHAARVEQRFGFGDAAASAQCGQVADGGALLPDPTTLGDKIVDPVAPEEVRLGPTEARRISTLPFFHYFRQA